MRTTHTATWKLEGKVMTYWHIFWGPLILDSATSSPQKVEKELDNG